MLGWLIKSSESKSYEFFLSFRGEEKSFEFLQEVASIFQFEALEDMEYRVDKQIGRAPF